MAKIQLLEEQKLRFTVDHQLALQQAQDDPDDELLDRNAKALKKKLTELAEEIRFALLLPLGVRQSSINDLFQRNPD